MTHDPEDPLRGDRPDLHGALENCGSWIPHWAGSRPDAPALVFEDRRLSYRALEDRVARLAGVMQTHRVGPGDRVALFLENRPAFLEAVFATARIGAIVLPVNTRLTQAEIAFILDDAAPSLILAEAAAAPLLDRACAGIERPGLQRLTIGPSEDDYESLLASASPVSSVRSAAPDDPMILMYTSGTTGTPKGALLPHRKAEYNCRNAQHCFGIQRTDRVLIAAPLFHSLGLQILALPVFHSGACVVLHRRFDPQQVLDALVSESIDYMGGVPTHYERLHTHLAGGPGLDSLRFLFTAGAAVAPELVAAYAERGLKLMQGYGQTETSLLCCLDGDDALRKAGSVGRALPHVALRVIARDSLDAAPDRWRDVEGDEIGEVVAKGPITMLEYWGRPEETARTLRDGWVLTGDLARIDPDGYVTLTGRSREMYISGGENVYPAEVEHVFSAHSDVREIAVVAEPDADWGEVGVAYVVLTPGCALDGAALQEWARERLAGFKIPRRFVSLDALPRTASGKVRKHRLAAEAGASRAG